MNETVSPIDRDLERLDGTIEDLQQDRLGLFEPGASRDLPTRVAEALDDISGGLQLVARLVRNICEKVKA